MSPGLLFCACPFSKSPLCKSPPRKFPFCALQETIFLSTLNWELSSFFSSIHKGKAFLPMLPSLPSASYPSRILTQKAWLLDVDYGMIYVKLKAAITQISFYRFPNTKIRERTYILLMILLEKLMQINILNIHMLSPCNLHQITTYFDSNQSVS